MPNYLRKLILFASPVIIFIVLVNCLIAFTPAMFRNKATYMEKHKNDVEVLFFGSSHTQDAINPLQIKSMTSVNLGYNTQDIKTNYQLFEKYVDETPKLKYVVFEFDYLALEQPLDLIKHNEPLYRKFYGFPNVENVFTKFAASITDIKFFVDYAYESTRYKIGNDYYVNEAGFIERNDLEDFKLMKHDSQLIDSLADQRFGNKFRYDQTREFAVNSQLVNNLINHCKKKNIEVILLSIPKYHTFTDRKMETKMAKRQHYLDSITTHTTNVKYFDYEQDKRFSSVTNYRDDNHLNPTGGNKFTLIVDSLLSTLNK